MQSSSFGKKRGKRIVSFLRSIEMDVQHREYLIHPCSFTSSASLLRYAPARCDGVPAASEDSIVQLAKRQRRGKKRSATAASFARARRFIAMILEGNWFGTQRTLAAVQRAGTSWCVLFYNKPKGKREYGEGRGADAVHERVKETHSPHKKTCFHDGGKDTRKPSSPAPGKRQGYSPHFFAVAALAMFFTRHAFLFLTMRM